MHELNPIHWVAIMYSCKRPGNSHIKYIFTVTLMVSDRPGVFARKKNLLTKWEACSDCSPKALFQDYPTSAGLVHPSGLTKPCSWAKEVTIYFHLSNLRLDSVHNWTGGNRQQIISYEWLDSCSQVRTETLQYSQNWTSTPPAWRNMGM